MKILFAMKNIFVIFLLFLINCSCKKNEVNCGAEMHLLGPEKVFERENIVLQPVDAPKGVNTYYNWNFVDMTPYPTGISVDDDGSVAVKDATIFDEGLYTFTVFPNIDECPSSVKATRYVTVLPLICPCYIQVQENLLQIEEDNSSQGVFDLPVSVHFSPDDFDTTSFTVTGYSSSDYNFELQVKTELNGKDRTFAMKNLISYWYGTEIPDDPEIQVWFTVSHNSYPDNTYMMEECANDIYLKNEGDKIIMTFCGATFRNKYDSTDYFIASGKFSFVL